MKEIFELYFEKFNNCKFRAGFVYFTEMMDSSSRSKQAPIYLLMNGPGLIIYSAAGYFTRNWR